MTAKIILGSRGSALALAQTRETRERLLAAWPELREDGAIEIRTVKTTGDVVRDRPLAELGGKGLFIKEVEGELLSGAIDAAVHSMKDMETTIADGTILAAVLPREDPRDAFISPHADSFEALPEGARIGTASVRRAALVLNRRPDLKVVMFRGNVDTRLRKLHDGEADATFLAVCGLKRLEMEHAITRIMEPDAFPPPVSQGAIGIQCRDGNASARDADIARWLSALDDAPSRARVTAERAMLSALDGSCRTPISGHAVLDGGRLTLNGLVLSLDGTQSHAGSASADAGDAEALGFGVGEDILSRCGRDFLA
ncbi:hydroxymethylbilane synthase [Thalassobaculum sp. OXR-137]|uniref:hydroxymethylbilane synthase n=1 Tax=Thalassobaculum sp. OXR-137 TaxID=3100173 RepID=UPI002AC9065E|nr:hydroxymethylbilane synthase [Thalassobaculum sp. OXR-137]WPZ35623.1 hydroxymethylbilane synthase [Thalassobaculum sp. OXR-137]